MGLDYWKSWAEFLLVVVGVLAAVGGVWTYHQNSRRERAQWLFELYQRLYWEPLLKPMRARIEAGETAFVSKEDDLKLLEQLDDYLNFFEFIAYLKRQRKISLSEIRDMFEYPLRKVRENKAIFQYVSRPEYGYEGVRELLRDLR